MPVLTAEHKPKLGCTMQSAMAESLCSRSPISATWRASPKSNGSRPLRADPWNKRPADAPEPRESFLNVRQMLDEVRCGSCWKRLLDFGLQQMHMQPTGAANE